MDYSQINKLYSYQLKNGDFEIKEINVEYQKPGSDFFIGSEFFSYYDSFNEDKSIIYMDKVDNFSELSRVYYFTKLLPENDLALLNFMKREYKKNFKKLRDKYSRESELLDSNYERDRNKNEILVGVIEDILAWRIFDRKEE